jgi:hypothetical protein
MSCDWDIISQVIFDRLCEFGLPFEIAEVAHPELRRLIEYPFSQPLARRARVDELGHRCNQLRWSKRLFQ